MKNTVKVLIVDDSTITRQLLKKSLETCESILVVATAANGLIALEKIPLYTPDLVLLDIEMPEMNGIETLKHIKRDYPELRVIMCSSLTEEGCQITLDCLSMGADDYLTKPSSLSHNSANMANGKALFEQTLHQKVMAFFQEEEIDSPISVKLAHPVIPLTKPPRIDILVIGISTGGPDALMKFIKQFPSDFPLPILIVQHMPGLFTRMLAERLNNCSALTVCEAMDGQKILAGTVYIAPGDYHMEINKSLEGFDITLNDREPVNYSRPSIDVLFNSVAQQYKEHCLALIMTGMGYDGLAGCTQIKDAGGLVFAQDKNSSAVWGMPSAVIKAELADQVIPLDSLYLKIAATLEKNNQKFTG